MARKQRIKVRVKQKKSLWQILKTIIVIVLILGILSFMRSCSDPKIKVDLPDGKLREWLEDLADFLPGGFIGLKKPIYIEVPDSDPGNSDGNVDDDLNDDEDGDGNIPTIKHGCDAEYITINRKSATCI